jgi:outer membrane protein
VKKLTRVLAAFGVTALLFSACQQPVDQNNANSEVDLSEVSISDLKIAYVHTDSVINNFAFFKMRSEEIADKGKKFESDLSSRARGFEQEVANFQQSAQSMTMNQARAKEEELIKKERNLVSYRDNLMQELSAEESQLYNEVYDRIQEFMKGYAEENNYEMILSYTRGGGVWYANKALDITKSVTDGINKAYSESGGKMPTKTDTVSNN